MTTASAFCLLTEDEEGLAEEDWSWAVMGYWQLDDFRRSSDKDTAVVAAATAVGMVVDSERGSGLDSSGDSQTGSRIGQSRKWSPWEGRRAMGSGVERRRHEEQRLMWAAWGSAERVAEQERQVFT